MNLKGNRVVSTNVDENNFNVNTEVTTFVDSIIKHYNTYISELTQMSKQIAAAVNNKVVKGEAKQAVNELNTLIKKQITTTTNKKTGLKNKFKADAGDDVIIKLTAEVEKLKTEIAGLKGEVSSNEADAGVSSNETQIASADSNEDIFDSMQTTLNAYQKDE